MTVERARRRCFKVEPWQEGLILFMWDGRCSDDEISAAVGLAPSTVDAVRLRYGRPSRKRQFRTRDKTREPLRESLKRALRRVEHDGRQARRRGRGSSGNPHDQLNFLPWRAWRHGWREEDKRQRRLERGRLRRQEEIVNEA